MNAVLVDTGVVFAYLSFHDQDHHWAKEQFAALRGPFLTCEAVLTETTYLVQQRGGDLDSLWLFLRRGVLQLGFDLATEFESVAVLMRRYADVPMDLADACLVRMSELHRNCRIITTDSDFKIYRRFGRQVIPLICPV
ncbi:MAG: PIN domain-containing protein [Verrucomicrobia bacterium]|nr:PIN domain-containing protein [Verrucomicrobiota bacterium]